MIYRREKERGTAFSAILGRYEPDIHWIHHRAGWLLQQRNAGAGSTDARLTHEEFKEIVDKRLQSSGHKDDGERLNLVKAIRLAATDRLVLLVGNTEKAIGFEIRSLQEFMAAEHFFDGGEVCVQQTLHAIAPYPYWRNVFLFAAGRIFFERQELIDSIIAVCGGMNDDPDDPAQRTILSGSRLALALLKDGAARNQPASIRVLARCGARGLDACDSEGALAFSELFSGEAEEVWKEELSKRLTTSGPAFPHHNWLLCLQLVGMGKPWAQELMVYHFPWRGEDALQFVMLMLNDHDEKQVPEAFWAEFGRNLFSHPPLYSFLRLRRPSQESPLTQFTSLFRHEEEWPLLVGGDSRGLSFRVRGKESLSLWAGFQYPETTLSTSHREWRVCQAVSAFARKPTKVNLAEQLRTISQIDPDAVSKPRSWFYPWQIAICLTARTAGRPWNEIIACVDAGDIGAEGDWIRWEERNRRGISLSQFRFTDGLRVSDEMQGAILRGSGWSFGGAPQEQLLQFAHALSDALVQWPEIRNQTRLVDLCCFCLNKGLGSAAAIQVIGRFIKTCSEQKVTLTTPVLAAVLCGSFSVDDKRNLLAKAGGCPIRRGWLEWRGSEASKFLDAIVRDLLAGDEWWNVLRALSFLPPLDALQQIPETFLEQLRLKSEPFSKAASSLRLNSLRWKACESAEVVREGLALEEDYPEHMWHLLEFIESGGKSGPHLEAFLVELIKQRPRNFGPELPKRATELLVKLVERRLAISRLPDPAIRQAGRLR